MASTFPIPLTTLPVGSQIFGPASASDAETSIVITSDRTVTGGMNSLTSASTLTLETQQSNDGGTTWNVLALATMIGGILPNAKTGGTFTTDRVTTFLQPGTSRQVRAIVTVAGPSSIAVQGTITTQ